MEEDKCIWVCPELHKFLNCSRKEKKKLGKLLQVEEVVTLNNSVFLEYVFGWHTGTGWKYHHELRYHTSVIVQ